MHRATANVRRSGRRATTQHDAADVTDTDAGGQKRETGVAHRALGRVPDEALDLKLILGHDPNPAGADVARVSPVPAQMWQG